MRGGDHFVDKTTTAHELNHSFIGSPITVNLPDGRELCTRLDGVIWSATGKVTIFVPVPVNDKGDRFLELEHHTPVMHPDLSVPE